jgi:DNA-binding transcriptional ArsR family regulator
VPIDPYAALGNPVRRRILDALRERPRPVGEIVALFELSRPAVSEHLRVLKDADLVAEERRGQQRVYHLTAGPLAEVDAWLHPFEQYWRSRLRDLADFLDEQEKGGTP